MQIVDKRTVYSATDLNNFLECRHLVWLERAAAAGEMRRPERPPSLELIAEKGRLHEQRYLEKLRADREVVEIEQPSGSEGAIERAAAETVAAMRRGAAAIYQGTFYDGAFQGRPDFLLRVDTPSPEWEWSYEVADTKLALHDKPYFIIQLCHYSEHLARVQGMEPKRMHVVLGDETEKPYRVEDFAAYYRHLKRSFLESRSDADVYPFEVTHCGICDWAEHCEQRRERDDHLGIVAWMRHGQIQRLEAAAITTVAALAADGASRPPGMREETFDRLRRQASLQVRGRQTGSNLYELLDHGPFEGFGLMPRPAIGDVFFDMEGDPLFDIGTGLEYLFGCYAPDDQQPFRPFWGTDRNLEKLAFEQCVDFLTARRTQFPEMHIYHYAPYEKTALRELAQRHATREDEVDGLLKGRVLVDLYAVVRQTLLISKPSYSIKQLEPFYGMTRTTDVRRGDDSVVQFETWLLDKARGDILADIERYNEQDCISTHLLRDWLLGRRDEYQTSRGVVLQFRPVKRPDELCHPDPVEGCKDCDTRVRDERELAKISADQQALTARGYDKAAVLLGSLLSYHRREEKPVWWEFFDRCENTDGLLEFDKEAIAGLTLRRDIAPFRRPGERTDTFTYGFPDQFFRLGPGDKPYDPFTGETAGTIIRIDEDANLLELKLTRTSGGAEKIRALIPGGPIVATHQKTSLARIAAAYLAGSLESTNRVVGDLLRRLPPRLAGRPPGSKIQPSTVSPESVYDVAKALDHSYLFVQGPPGSGKTYTGARVIVKMIADGARVGVMANSHRAVHHLLHEIESFAQRENVAIRGVHKHSGRNEGSEYKSVLAQPLIESADDNSLAEDGDHNLVSGNSWLFSRAGMAKRVDYLIIDEAGQTSLADAIAVSPSATNMILLGDPMQLAQVSQGSHPEGADNSILEHLLQDASTVPEGRGILLDISYRMHPDICEFVSQTMYDGRLHADPPNALNHISSSGLTGGGMRFIPVVHSGNAGESGEEAQTIADEVGRLLSGGRVTRRGESDRPLLEADILVVTPYNAQRRLILDRLRAAGHPSVRVGTVDKFQGQEAPVVFYSMATSSGDDIPRTMEFLYERNRFNVAVSRAQCLSVLVCSPKLFEIRCNRPEQIKLVNVLCKFVEMARPAAKLLSA